MVRANRSTRRRASVTASHGSAAFMQPKSEAACEPVALQTKIIPIAPRFEHHAGEMNNYTCSFCSQPIHERQLLLTQDRLSRGHYWHMQCLRCQCCDVVLAEVASTFYTKDNALLCKSDYMKRYGGSRPCSSCSQMIGTNERIMRASPNHVYHLPCFHCIKCLCPLLKGDRYVLFNGQLFCEKDNPLKTSNKRGSATGKRAGAKARTTAQSHQAYPTASSQRQPMGQLSLLTPHPLHVSHPTTITHSLLNNQLSNVHESPALLGTTSEELF